MSTPPRVKPFNELAKSFDPMMDQKTYDALREKYFESFVAPKIPQGFSVRLTRDEFMKQTERPKLLPSATAAVAEMGALSAGEQLLQPLAPLSSKAKNLLNTTQVKKENLRRAMQRDGVNSTTPDVVGNLIGTGVGFAGIELATRGAGTALGVDELLAGVARGAKALEFAQKATKGGLAFGTYEALVDKKQERGYAFARGAALGVGAEVGMSLASKLLTRGKVKPQDIEKEVANTLEAEPSKEISPEVDQIVAKHIEEEQVRAKAEGKPLLVKVDNSSRKIRVLGADGKGRPFTLVVEPNAEARTLEVIRQHLQEGGQVDAILYHEDELGAFNRFSKMAKDLGALPQTETRVVGVKRGKAKTVAAQMKVEGIPAEPVGPSRVEIEVPKPSTPSLASLSAELSAHVLPNGTRLQKSEVWDYARRLFKLHSPDVSPQAKEQIAQGLVGSGLDKFIPEEWRRTPEELGKEAPTMEESGTFENPVLEVMQEEIGAKSRHVSPFSQIAPDTPFAKEAGTLPAGFHIEDEGTTRRAAISAKMQSDPFFKKASDLFERGFSTSQVAKELGLPNGKVRSYFNAYNKTKLRKGLQLEGRLETASLDPQLKVSERGSKVAIRMSPPLMERITGGVQGAFTTEPSTYRAILRELGIDTRGLPQIDKPVMGYLAGASRRELYHESLHVGLSNLIQGEPVTRILTGMLDKETLETASKIAKELATEPGYEEMEHLERVEEAYVYAAEAVRFGNVEGIRTLAQLDTSVSHVIDMVDRTSENLLLHSFTKPDTMGLREFQERMRDLLRRTGRGRLERWLDDADRAGHDLHYNAERDEFVLSDGHTSTHINPKGSVADEIDHLNGAAEYTPSATIGFERRGLRYRVAPLRAVPYSEKNMPMPELTPSEDRFKGIATLTSLIKPAQDWFAYIDQRFEKAGMKLGIFDKFKAIDDAVRHGERWLSESFATASTFLKGDANRLKTMFEFLTADPQYWERMLPRFGMDKGFLKDVQEANKWLERFRDETGIPVFNYLRNDLPKLRNFNYESRFVWGQDVKSTKEMSFFRRAVTEGALNPRDGHAGRFINFLIRSGYEEKYLKGPLAEMEKLLRLEDASGKSVLGTLRYPIQNYVNYVKGIPDVTHQSLIKAVGDFQKRLGVVFREINKSLPPKYHLPEEFNYPGSVVNKLITLSYVAGVGLRPILPIRDALQVLTNTLPILGPKKLLYGLTRALSSDGFREAREAGALLGRHTIGDLYGDIFQEIPPHSGGTLDKALEMGNKLLSPSRWGHNIGRAVAFHGEYGAALKAIEAYRKGAIDVGRLFEDTSMWFFPKPLQTRILEKIARGEDVREVAKTIALETVDLTLWPYRRGTQPLFLRTGVGRIFGQYGLWPLNYLEFLKRLASKYAEHPTKAMKAAGLWLATNYAASSTLSGFGADVGKWFYLSPSGYGGSPHMELVLDIMKAPEESQEGRDARKRILEYPLNFVPASIETEAILKAIESGEPAFDSSGKPTKSFIRVLGMKPKSEHLQDLTPEEWLKYETGFKESR